MKSNPEKATKYAHLVQCRKAYHDCPKLTNPADVDGGGLDSNEIGPYSQWQGNLNARLMVVAQDFADVESFRRYEGWPGETVQTNLALVELLAKAGFKVNPPRKGTSDDQVFFTNAVLCLKTGKMSGVIPRKYYRNCGTKFLRPLIKLVNPQAVVTLGTNALDAVLWAYEMKRSGSLRELIRSRKSYELPNGIRVFPVYHPSPTVKKFSRSSEEQCRDWEWIGSQLAKQE